MSVSNHESRKRMVCVKLTIRPRKGAIGTPSSETRSSSIEDPDSESELDGREENQGESSSSKAAMLAALEAHGRAMFGFGLDVGETSEQGRKRMSEEYGSEDEVSLGGELEDEEEDEGHTDDGWGAEDGFVSDSEYEYMAISEASLSFE